MHIHSNNETYMLNCASASGYFVNQNNILQYDDNANVYQYINESIQNTLGKCIYDRIQNIDVITISNKIKKISTIDYIEKKYTYFTYNTNSILTNFNISLNNDKINEELKSCDQYGCLYLLLNNEKEILSLAYNGNNVISTKTNHSYIY